MHNKIIKALSLGLLSTSVLFSSVAFAEKKKAEPKAENIDVTQQQVTKEELATIYVFSEMCQPLVKQDAAYKAGYARLLKEYLPNEKDPQAALKSLVKQSSFKKVLEQARQDAKNAGDKENLEICQDMKNY